MQKISSTQLLQNLPDQEPIQQLSAFADERGVELYLVGGCVRDFLLNRPTTDLDFALEKDAVPFARALADALGAAFITLEEQPPTARVVIRETRLTLDFAQFRAGTLEDDLRLRDLTINAIALNLSLLIAQPSVDLIDPCDGLQDLKSGQLRFPSEGVVLDDPLRLLRVYRFAAQLGFEIPEETLNLVRRHKNLLGQVEPSERPRDAVAGERIRDELIKIVDATNATTHVRQMDHIRLLSEILPEIDSMRDLQQNDYHHLDVWEHSLLALEMFEEQSVPGVLQPYQGEVQEYLNTDLVVGVRRETVIKLSLLLHDVAKPVTKTVNPQGKVRFIEHENVGAEIAVQIVRRLRFGGKAAKLMSCLVRNHLRIMHLLNTGPTRRSVARFLKSTAQDWLGVLLLSYADLRASQGKLRKPDDISRTEQLMKQIADCYYLEMRPMMTQERLITGDDIMDAFDLKPGVIIGHILKHIEELQFDGKVHTPEEALVAARRFLETCK